MKNMLLELVFPLSWEEGASLDGINQRRMRQLATQSRAVTKEELQDRIEEHHRFLQQGGDGGLWQMLLLDGLVVAVYQKTIKTKAQQFSLEYRQLSDEVSLAGVVLPFINCCAALLPGLQAEKAVLSQSVFTDAFVLGANFSKAQLQNTDFSRADLRKANFSQADLSGCDFENCDLQEADFRGARIVGARFPGARLEGVLC